MSKFSIAFVFALSAVNSASAEIKTMDRVRFFDTFFTDAVRLDSPYVEIGAAHKQFENGSTLPYQLRTGFPVTQNIDIEASIGGINVDPEFGHEQMDVGDFSLVGRYHFTDFKPANLAAGMRFDFPTGDIDQGQDTLEFELFGAIRIPVTEKFVTATHLGFGYIETQEHAGNRNSQQAIPAFNLLQNSMYTSNGIVASSHRVKNTGEFSFFGSSKAIYEVNSNLHITGEFSGDSGHGVGYFSSGMDYEVFPNGRLRFAVGAGFGDRAPEYVVQGGFLFNFGR